jgi:predicted ATPase
VTQLADMSGTGPAELADCLSEAITGGLMVANDGLRFAHVLIQEVAYRELPEGERQRLHLRAAEVTAGSLDAQAHHLRQATARGSAQQALEVTLRAARQARTQLAYEHAAYQYRQALDLLPLLSQAPVTRLALQLAIARCDHDRAETATSGSS